MRPVPLSRVLARRPGYDVGSHPRVSEANLLTCQPHLSLHYTGDSGNRTRMDYWYVVTSTRERCITQNSNNFSTLDECLYMT